MPEKAELLSVKQFSAKKNISTRTVYRLLKDGVLPKIVFNQRTIRIPVDEAELVMNKLTQHSLMKETN